jgi:predicted permease
MGFTRGNEGAQRRTIRHRGALGFSFVGSLVQDVHFSVRVLRKSPGFSVVAILTMALAIGANAVVFSVLNALIFRPLNVPQPESLYAIEHGREKSTGLSYPDFLDLREHNRSFEGLAFSNTFQAGLDTGEKPSRAWVFEVSGNYFDVLTLQPYLGRLIHASDEHGPGSAPYVVLTYEYWQSHFQGDRGVVGRTIRINKHPFTIIGVAARGFHGAVLFFSPDFFVPMVSQQGQNTLNERGITSMDLVIGRLKAGVTPQQAIDDLKPIGSWLERNYPKTDGDMSFVLARPNLWGDAAGPIIHAFLTALMLLAGLILLAACANLGSLFAARAADRSREIALRLALGAGRLRIMRTVFTEALLISLVGGAAGLWGSAALLDAMSVWQPVPKYPIHMAVNPDAHVYAVALLLTLASGFLFGAVPVKQALHTDPYEIVKSGSRATGGRRITFRELLLGVQIAICAVLVTSSVVAVRGMMRSLHSNFGFDPQNAMLMDTDLNMAGYRGPRSVNYAEAHRRRYGNDSWRHLRGFDRSAAIRFGHKLLAGFCQRHGGSEASECGCAGHPVQCVSWIFPCCEHSLVIRKNLHLARRSECAARGGNQPRVCAQSVWLVKKRDVQILQVARRNARTGGRHCRKRKIREPHGRFAASGVFLNSAIASECDDAGGALESRSQASSGGDEEQAAGSRCGPSLLHPDLV